MKIFKKITYRFFGFLLVLIIMIFIILNYFEKDLYVYILEKIQKNINTEISFQKTKLSLFRYFPNAAVTFYKVSININKGSSHINIDSINNHNSISVDELTIKINFLQLFKNPIVISGVELKNGSILLLEDKFGNNNYQLESNLSKNSGNLLFQVRKISMHNINFKYLNEKSFLYINTHLNSLNISGVLQNNNSNFKTIASLTNISILSNSSSLVLNFPSNISFRLASKPESITFKDGEILTNNETFRFKGYFFLKNSKKFNFVIQAQSLKFRNVNQFSFHLPKDLLILGGKFSIFLNLYGEYTNYSDINFNALSIIKNLSIEYKKYPLQGINCKLLINGRYNKTLDASFIATSLYGNYYNSVFSIPYIKYETISDSLNGTGSINIKCKDLQNIINDTVILIKRGEINMSFILNSCVNEKFKFDLLKIFENSHLVVKDLNCSILKDNYIISNFNSDIFTLNNILHFNHLFASINNNNISFEGFISNYQALGNNILGKLEIIGELKSKYFNVNNFIRNNLPGKSNNSVEFKNLSIFVKLNIDLDNLFFNNCKLSNYHSSFQFSNKCLVLKNISTNFCEGKITNGNIDLNFYPNLVNLTSNCEFKDINIKMLFTIFNDFEQKEIISKNIKGQLNGNANYKLLWKNNTFSNNDFQGVIDFDILNGELNGFQPIYKLSKFIELSELNNIKFKKISNKISVNNNIVSIPFMNLNTSAINFSLSGSHSLDNKYEYHFKVILSNLLISKKQNKNSFPTENDTLRVIYIKLNGDSNFYKLSYDSKFASQAFNDKLRIERSKLKNLFNEEFGVFKGDSTLIKNNSVIESEYIKSNFKQNKIEKKHKPNRTSSKIEWKDD
jgi:AsmA-like C-terminal region